jgi:hypothetical protein
VLLFAFAANVASVAGAEYKLKDGTAVSGEPVSFTDKGVILKDDTGKFGSRIDWNRFSQEALREFAKNPRILKIIENLLDSPPAGEADPKEESIATPEKPKKPALVLREYPKPERPSTTLGFSSGFSTPIGIVFLLILYAANIYAGQEVAIFRRRPKGLVCGVAAAVPVIGPLLFLSLPPAAEKQPEPVITEAAPAEAAPAHGAAAAHGAHGAPVAEAAPAEAAAPEPPPPPPAPKLPSYKRGEFTINRRFVETKLSSFFKAMPSEEEKKLVVAMKTARGEFVGRRITKITPTDLTLAIGDENAYYDQLVPFNDILEIEIRLKEEAQA